MATEKFIDTDRIDLDALADYSEPSVVYASEHWLDLIERNGHDIDATEADAWLLGELMTLFVAAHREHDMDVIEFITALECVTDHISTVAGAAVSDYAERTGQTDTIDEIRSGAAQTGDDT